MEWGLNVPQLKIRLFWFGVSSGAMQKVSFYEFCVVIFPGWMSMQTEKNRIFNWSTQNIIEIGEIKYSAKHYGIVDINLFPIETSNWSRKQKFNHLKIWYLISSSLFFCSIFFEMHRNDKCRSIKSSGARLSYAMPTKLYPAAVRNYARVLAQGSNATTNIRNVTMEIGGFLYTGPKWLQGSSSVLIYVIFMQQTTKNLSK